MKIEVPFPELKTVLHKMGIEELVRDEHTSLWETIDTRLRGEGIESTTLDDVEVAPDGTLSYEGRKIIVYIRDQEIRDSNISDPENLRRFHIVNCNTLEQMQSMGQYNRYVRSTREDGIFIVNIMRYGEIIDQGKLVELLVCQHCLGKLKHDGFSPTLSSEVKKKMAREFSLKEFFDRYA